MIMRSISAACSKLDSKMNEPLVFQASSAIHELASRGRSICIDELVEPAVCITPETLIREAKEMLGVDEPIKALVVARDEKPIGLVSSLHLDRRLSKQFGVALFYPKPVSKVMDKNPLNIEAGTPLRSLPALRCNARKQRYSITSS